MATHSTVSQPDNGHTDRSHSPLHQPASAVGVQTRHEVHASTDWPVNPEAERIKQLIRRAQPPVVDLGPLSETEQHHFDPNKPRTDPDPNWFTPWLVVAAFPGDDGTRPIASNQLTGQSIWIERFQQAGVPVSIYSVPPPYQVAVRIDNRGYASSYGAIVEFYFSADPVATGSPPIPIGSPVAMVVPEGTSAIVRSGQWTPPWTIPAYGYLTVRVYDPVFDATAADSFDPAKDRHVGQSNLSLTIPGLIPTPPEA